MNTGKLDIVKREMERTKVEILGISELKWTEMGHFQSDEYNVYSILLYLLYLSSVKVCHVAGRRDAGSESLWLMYDLPPPYVLY